MIEQFQKMMMEARDRVIGFIVGDASAMFAYLNWGEELLELGHTAIIGLVGGMAGLFAKDVYNFIKNKIKSKIGNSNEK